jgi:methylglutaconyl-CoA hydratase
MSVENPEIGRIKISIENKVAYLSFYHPLSNSFPTELLLELTTVLTNLGTDKKIQLIVLQSLGEGAFCAGASFDELLAVDTLESGKLFFSGFANVINAMRKCPKIIVARVHGKAVGGGVGLIAACDYAFATTKAAVKLSELAIGIGPFVIEPVVSKKIGKTNMSALTLAPLQWKSAHWALEKGLFQEVFESTDLMDTAIEAYTIGLSNYNPEALVEMKKILWENTENWDVLLSERAAISGKLVLSDFTKKALEAFKNKKK